MSLGTLRAYLWLYLFARLVTAFLPSMWAWGVNVQRFLDPLTGWGLWTLAAVSLLPAVARRVETPVARVGEFLVHSPRALWAAALVGAGVAWLMPDRVWFVGDFMLRQGQIESDAFGGVYEGEFPLDYLLHSALLQPFGLGSIEAANASLRVLGALEAGVLAVMAVLLARTLETRRAIAAMTAGALFFGGFLTMFTGLGKAASEVCVVTAGLGITSLRALRRPEKGLWTFTLVLGLACLLHRSAVLLVPLWATTIALWLPRRRAHGPLHRADWAALAVSCAVVAAAVPAIVSVVGWYDLPRHIATAEVRSQGGLLRSALSLPHVVAVANLVLALSPLALLTPFLLAGRVDRSDRWVLAALVLPFLALLLFAHPQQGIFRDWDVFAPAGVALSLLAGYALASSLSRAPERSWLAISALVMVTVSALQWLALNAQTERGLARVKAYLLEAPGPAPSEQPLVLWDFLAARNLRLRRWHEAANAASHAAELAPHHPRILLMWAIAETMQESYGQAASIYRRMLERQPDDPLALIGLAGAAVRLDDTLTVRQTLEKLRAFPPNSPRTRAIRLHLRYYPQVWPLPLS